MAILAQYNPFRFFANKLARIWDKNEESRKTKLLVYQTGYVPSFEVAVLTAQNYPNHWRFTLYTCDDVVVSEVGEVDTDLIIQYDRDIDYFNIGYYGGTFAGTTEGSYYIALTDGTQIFYSDMFKWVDNPDVYNGINGINYMKISVRFAPITVDTINNYTISMDEDIDFYLNVKYIATNPKIEQDGKEQNAITDVIFGTRSIQRVFDVNANESIYMYLSALGVLKGNGTITITYGYITYNATDIMIEEGTNHSNETYQLKLTFVDQNESVQKLNA